jgi:photosystem II stability/assembly factor-like uncharacterized protein
MWWSRLAILAMTMAVVSCTFRGGMAEVWEPADAPVKIRLKRFKPWPRTPFLPPSYYALESSTNGKGWREIANWRTDDQYALPKDQVRFVGDRVACVFFRNLYVLTTDGGRTWSTWDSMTALPSLRFPMIVDAKLEDRGRGSLAVKYVANGGYGTVTLKTNDYGLHWAMPNP